MESRSPRPTPEDLTALLGLLGEALLRQRLWQTLWAESFMRSNPLCPIPVPT